MKTINRFRSFVLNANYYQLCVSDPVYDKTFINFVDIYYGIKLHSANTPLKRAFLSFNSTIYVLERCFGISVSLSQFPGSSKNKIKELLEDLDSDLVF